MDWSWWLVNLRAGTSKTISISLTLQAHPLIGREKSDTLTKHIPPAVSSSKGSHDGRPPHPTPALCGCPGTTCPGAELPLLHSVGEPVGPSASPRLSGTPQWHYLPAKCLRWCSNGLHFSIFPPHRDHMREVTYGHLWWIPLLFLKNLQGLQGDRNFTLLYNRVNLIISQ